MEPAIPRRHPAIFLACVTPGDAERSRCAQLHLDLSASRDSTENAGSAICHVSADWSWFRADETQGIGWTFHPVPTSDGGLSLEELSDAVRGWAKRHYRALEALKKVSQPMQTTGRALISAININEAVYVDELELAAARANRDAHQDEAHAAE